MTQKNRLRNILIVVNIILLCYFSGLVLYSESRSQIPLVNALAEMITIPILLILCISGTVSLIKWIAKDKFRIQGYFVPLLIALSTAAMLLVAK